MADISTIILPNNTEFHIKDSVARDMIGQLNSFEYIICTSAENTPSGITFNNITGSLEASANTKYKIYLVPSANSTNDIYDEYITVDAQQNSSYVWEKIGNTDVNLSAYLTSQNAENTYATKSNPIINGTLTIGSTSMNESDLQGILDLLDIPSPTGQSF